MQPTFNVLDHYHGDTGPHGGPIDYAAIDSQLGLLGYIHKATQGLAMVDSAYAERRQAVAAIGAKWGAYHFGDNSDPLAQAQHFLTVAQPDDNTLVALDFEPNGSRTMSLNQARAFLQAIDDALGRKCVLYSGNLIKEQLGNKPDPDLASHRLWLAHYNDTPRWPPAWEKPWLHQFSGDGVNSHGIIVPGIDSSQAGKLDLNCYSGSDIEGEWAS